MESPHVLPYAWLASMFNLCRTLWGLLTAFAKDTFSSSLGLLSMLSFKKGGRLIHHYFIEHEYFLVIKRALITEPEF